MRKFARFLVAVIDIALLFTAGIFVAYSVRLPDNYYVSGDDSLKLSTRFRIDTFENEKVIESLKSKVEKNNDSKAVLKLFGIIPIKEVSIKSVDSPVLVPGGNPFGIKLLSDGVMVIGVGDVKAESGAVSPSGDAGIKIGDVIISVNGQKVMTNAEIGNIISSSNGNPVDIIFKRDDVKMEVQLSPAYSVNDSCYRAGMYVRDSTAGIGTITFYDPQTDAFGGLGHPVCDVDTGEIIPLSSGEVVNVNINGVNKGEPGKPGELLGSFSSIFSVGDIQINNSCGLFGTLNSTPNLSSAIPLGMRQEIQTGEATILSTIEGSEPKEYKISIEKIDLKDDGAKNMVIRITDPELLSKTGGIVQGMSGSPIIQNGKLIGAVTHVFVNDPTKGYGIFCDKMYHYSTLTSKEEKISA